MKKLLLFLAMVTVSVATWAQENGVYRAIEGEAFQEYISKLTKCLFNDKLLLWDDVVDEIEESSFSMGATTSETTYYDKKNGLIVKVIRKPSEEIEKDFNRDLKRTLPQSVICSNLDKGKLQELANETWNEMKKFDYAKGGELPYNFMLYGFTKERREFNLIYKDL